jgi:hypothetical protein
MTMKHKRTREYLLVRIYSAKTHKSIGMVVWKRGLLPFASDCRNEAHLVSSADTIQTVWVCFTKGSKVSKEGR